jgi:SAM-dependent methyltransferase
MVKTIGLPGRRKSPGRRHLNRADLPRGQLTRLRPQSKETRACKALDSNTPGDLAMTDSFTSLLRTEPEEVTQFSFIDPPFNFNHPDVAQYPAEVTGHYLMQSMRRRLGWTSFKGKRLLDFGCGVRFSRTIVNLGVDIGLYCGVDVNEKAIAWLNANVHDPKLRFEHLNMYNPLYNAAGAETDNQTLERLGLSEFDAVCMFSVITHQAPDEAEKIFSMLYPCVSKGGKMYFTAFVDPTVEGYVERQPENPGMVSTYNPEPMLELLKKSGWTLLDVFPAGKFQQAAFVCRK